MKRIISFILALVFAAAVLPASSAASTTTHGYVWGDATDDGKFTISDVLLIRKHIAGIAEDKDICFLAADVTEDKLLTLSDVLAIRKALIGIEDTPENNSDGAYRVGEIKIGGRNISRYTIVYPGDIDLAGVYMPAMEHAVFELQDYIRRACGVALNIATSTNAPEGYTIQYKFDVDDKYGLGMEGFVFDLNDDGDFIVTCGSQRAPLYATYTFLEDLVGYRFLPADIVYLYGNTLVDIPDGYYDVKTPGFEYRGINQAGTSYRDGKNGTAYDGFEKLRVNALDGGGIAKDWNGGGLGTLYIHAHSMAYQMFGYENCYSPEANDFTSEYHTKQPCMTKEETYEKILDFNYKLIDERNRGGQRYGYHYTQISCSTNDNTNYCTCVDCKTIYEYEKSVAGAVIRLANRVAEKMTQDYPELDIYTIAYAGGNVAPRYTRPHEKVCVCFCTTGCNNHSLRNTYECDEAGGNQRMKAPVYYGGESENYNNSKDMAYLDSWLGVTDNIYFWYYCSNYNYFMAPAANLFNFYDDIKYLKERGLIGIYAEGSSEPCHYSFEYLRNYLISRMLWDPLMTEEEYEGYMDEFLMIYYGDGWEYIKQYIFMSNYASDINGCWTNNHDAIFDIYNEEYFRDNYAEMARLFDLAWEAAKTEEQKFRVASASVHAHFMGLAATYERDYVNGDAASRAEYARRYEDLRSFYEQNAYDKDTNPMGIKGTVFGKFGTANFEAFPSESDPVVNPLAWIFEEDPDFNGHAGSWEFPFGKKGS